MIPKLAEVSSAMPVSDLTIQPSAAYSDPDGNALASADWQLAKDTAFTQLVLSRTIPGRTDLTVAPGVLDPSQTYWMRTRQRDSMGAVSDWSPPVQFVTAATAVNDTNGNGIVDYYEVSGFVDSNHNGINDADEGLCNLYDADNFNVVGFESDAGQVQCYSSVPSSNIPAPAVADATLPFGMFNFRIEGLKVDAVHPATVTLRVHLPSKPSGDVKWYKLDPATHLLTQFAGAVTFEGNTAVIQLTDGGPETSTAW